LAFRSGELVAAVHVFALEWGFYSSLDAPAAVASQGSVAACIAGAILAVQFVESYTCVVKGTGVAQVSRDTKAPLLVRAQ